MGKRRRKRVDPTGDWEQIELLCEWDEQRENERIRSLVLFGRPVPERSAETGVSERALYRKIAAFREEGMESLFASPEAKRRADVRYIKHSVAETGQAYVVAILENYSGAILASAVTLSRDATTARETGAS